MSDEEPINEELVKQVARGLRKIYVYFGVEGLPGALYVKWATRFIDNPRIIREIDRAILNNEKMPLLTSQQIKRQLLESWPKGESINSVEFKVAFARQLTHSVLFLLALRALLEKELLGEDNEEENESNESNDENNNEFNNENLNAVPINIGNFEPDIYNSMLLGDRRKMARLNKETRNAMEGLEENAWNVFGAPGELPPVGGSGKKSRRERVKTRRAKNRRRQSRKLRRRAH